MGLITKLTNIATSISNKTGQPASEYTLDTMPSAIDSIQTSFPEPQEDENWAVRFVDYDGAVISEMTYTQAQAITSLPEIPTHDDLTAIGWTSTIEEVKSIAEPNQLNVGVMYQTTDGTNRFYLRIGKETKITLLWSQTVENGVVVDWGDGSATETNSGTGAVTLEHTYTGPSEPVLTMQSVAGNTLTLGVNNKNIFNTTDSNYYLKTVYLANGVELGGYAFQDCRALTSITIPNSVTSIGIYAFYNCYALTSITIPNSVTNIGNSAFSGCYALTSITIPDSVTSIYYNTFQACFTLTSITIPNSVTSIGNRAFQYCNVLTSIAIPDSVTSIGDSAFQHCNNITLDLSSATKVPTASGDIFGGTANHPTILVPSALFSDFQSATNWSTYANFMKGV